MIWAELKKLKRHYLLPLSIGVVVLSSLLALFQLTGAANSVVGYLPLTDGILWNNITLTFPFLITFFGSYLMNREYSEDTLKNNLIVPVSYSKLKFAKIAITVFATFLFIAVSFLCSIMFALVLQYPFNLADIGMAFWKLLVTGISCLIAVMPIIAFFSLKRNLFLAGTCVAFVYGFCGIFVANTRFTSWYPTTTGLSIIKYAPNSANYQISVSIFVLAICLFISLFIISVIRRKRDD